MPALGRQRQVDLCEFEASLVYRASSRTIKATQRNPVSKQSKTRHHEAIALDSRARVWVPSDGDFRTGREQGPASTEPNGPELLGTAPATATLFSY